MCRYESPSNKALNITATVLDDGTEVALDQEQANLLNGQGVITAINCQRLQAVGQQHGGLPLYHGSERPLAGGAAVL